MSREGHKHAARYREIAHVLLDEGFGYSLHQLGLGRFAPLGGRIGAGPPHDSPPVRARRVLERLGPAFVKAGQLLSTRPDLLPPEYIEQFRRLQDAVPALPFDEIRPVVEAELGGSVTELFASLDPTPIAAASIGQVHAAVLPGGEDVVVKVQRPGIRRTVETDLDILRTQAAFVERHTSWGKTYSVADNAEQLARILLGELDYIQEARNAERFRRDFEGDDTVVVPEVRWGFTTRRIITLDRLFGIKLSDTERLRDSGYDPGAIARTGMDAYLKQIFVTGFFHADPHPGNLFVLEGGRIGFSDFGRVGSVTEATRREFSDILLALFERDARDVVEGLLHIGVAHAGVDRSELRSEIALLLDRYYDASLGEVRMADLVQELMGVIHRLGLRVPPEFILLLGTLGTLEGVGTQIDPGFNLMEAARPFVVDLVRERFSPRAVARGSVRAIRHLALVAGDFPDSVARLVRRAAEGEFVIEVRPEGFDDLVVSMRELVNRLAFAILVGSFVVGFSLLLRGSDLPRWFLAASRLALAAAAVVGAWLFLSIFRSILRSRR